MKREVTFLVRISLAFLSLAVLSSCSLNILAREQIDSNTKEYVMPAFIIDISGRTLEETLGDEGNEAYYEEICEEVEHA